MTCKLEQPTTSGERSNSSKLDAAELIKKRGFFGVSNEGNQNIYSVDECDIFWIILSIVQRTIAVLANAYLAYEYFRKDQISYFVWTTACIASPMLVTTSIYINMYVQDRKSSTADVKKWSTFQIIWMLLISHFFFRYWRSLTYALKCRNAEALQNRDDQKIFYKRMIKEESDIALVRIFECYLETVPQKILQISIVLGQADYITPIQTFTICQYFISMGWSMVVYHRYNRYAQIDKENINISGVICQFLWHFSICVSRSLCIALVASLFPHWTLLACVVRALFAGVLTFLIDKPNFCSDGALCNFAFSLVLGFIYIFAYIMPKEGQTRTRYAWFYTLAVLENIACVSIFIIFSADYTKESLWFIPLCALALAFYLVGIVIMVMYYKYFHPNLTIRAKAVINNN